MVQDFHNSRSLSKIVQFNFCSIYSLDKYCLLLHTELILSDLMTLSTDLVPKRTVHPNIKNKEAKSSMIFQCYEHCIMPCYGLLVFLHNSLVIIFLDAPSLFLSAGFLYNLLLDGLKVTWASALTKIFVFDTDRS